MSDLAQLDLEAAGGQARIRALLEDLMDYLRRGLYGIDEMALAVWYEKSPRTSLHNVLTLFSRHSTHPGVALWHENVSLRWLTGSKDPPFVNVYAASVNYFNEQLQADPSPWLAYRSNAEVLYFDKKLLPAEVLEFFNLVTEPSGLIKGWYLASSDYDSHMTVRQLLAPRQQQRPWVGLVKTIEAPDSESCRGLIHVEFNQQWLPLSEAGLTTYTYYNDWQDGRPGYLLFEGGSLYRIDKFEVKTVPDYSALVLKKSHDDRYPEVYLRAVHPPEQSAA